MKPLNLVIENKEGEVIRNYLWDSKRFQLIQRSDTQRIEPLIQKNLLIKQNVEFKILIDVSVQELQSQPVQVEGLGLLKVVNGDETLSTIKDVELHEDSNESYLHILRWSAVSHFALVALLLITGLWIIPLFQEEELVVEIAVQERPIQRKKMRVTPKNTVQASKKKIKPVKHVAAQKPKKQVRRHKKVAKNRGKAKTPVHTQKKVNVNQLGALAALGGHHSGHQRSKGLNIDAIKTGGGSGFSNGHAGRGGSLGVVASKGLVSKGVGAGQGASVGHTGTRGQGGGRAGYGKMSLGGSSKNYSYPLADEALIQGGLDRHQVDAVIQKHLGEVVYCYEKGLQNSPSLRGRISVDFVISGRGQVSTARVANTSLRSDKVENCLINKLKNWQFPKPVGNVNVKVSYPFMMKRIGHG